LPDALFTFDMKRNFILSMLIPFAMICSCQKQDSTAEQQLAQRKTELDAREDALIEKEKVAEEREKALDKRENALAENEKAAANARMIPPAQSSDTISDPTQTKAERDRKIQEIAAEFRAMIPNSSNQKDRITKERLSQAQGALKELMSQKQPKWQMSGAAGSPALEAASATPSSTPQ
jgi:uncharacterized protein (DUF3084 family)